MEMDKLKVESIFKKVLELTEISKIKWEVMDIKKPYSFFTEIGGYTIYISSADSITFSFTIRRSDPNVELGRLTSTMFGKDGFFAEMETLFNAAKAKALKINEGLDELMSNLNMI